MQLGFPSADFPAPPPFVIETPDDWRVVPSVTAEAVVVAPISLDGVSPNVVVNIHKMLATDDPAALLEGVARRQLAAAGAESDIELDFTDPTTCSMSFTRRETVADQVTDGLASTDPGEVSEQGGIIELRQQCFYHYIDGPHLAFVATAIGTAAEASKEGQELVESVITSIRF